MKTFVVGGGSGLGAEIVRLARHLGDDVGYSTSSEREDNVGLCVNSCDLHDPRQLERLIAVIDDFMPNRLIICPIHTRYAKLTELTTSEVAEDIRFNVANIINIATAYATRCPTGSVTFLLSHICFLYNPGFTLYKVGKDAVDSFAKSIQFEYPDLKVLRTYPGAMKTNFASNTRYRGLSIFPPKNPGLWAQRILARDHGCLIGPVDFVFMMITRLLPFAAQKILFQLIFRTR